MAETIGPASPVQGANNFADWIRGLLTPAGSKEDIFTGMAGGLAELGNPEYAQRQRWKEKANAQPVAPQQNDALQAPPSEQQTPMGSAAQLSLEDLAGRGMTGPAAARPQPQEHGPAMGTGGPSPDPQMLPAELATSVMDREPPSMVRNENTTSTVSKGDGKSHLLSNILKAMGLAAGGVAISKFGGAGALEGSLGGLATGWAGAKKQLMDDERKRNNDALQRQLDDAHSVVEGLMKHGVDITQIPELQEAYQNYVSGFTGGKVDLKGAQALNLAYAQHVHEVQQQIETQAARGAEENAYRGQRGQNRGLEERRTVGPGDAQSGNFNRTPEQASQEAAQRAAFTHQDTMQGRMFGQQMGLEQSRDSRMAAQQYQQQLSMTRAKRAEIVQHLVNQQLQSMGPLAMGMTPEQRQQLFAAAEQQVQQQLPDPEPPPGLAGNRMVSPPRQAAPAGPTQPSQPMSAINRSTGQRIISKDGGQSWTDEQGNPVQ